MIKFEWSKLKRLFAGAHSWTGVQTFTQIKWAKGADIASATALTLGTDGNYFDVTGSTAITSIGTLGVGTFVGLHFDAALTLTHHATNLILPGGANITTAAGDEAMFEEYDTGKWRCVSYSPATGYVTRALFNAQTVLAATSDNTPAALTVAEQTLVGRKTSGNVAALTIAEVLTMLGLSDAMTYKGVIDCSGNPNYPAANAGDYYKISVAGKIGGASGTVVEAGDSCICTTDSTASGDQATVGAYWNAIQTNIDMANPGPIGGTTPGAINHTKLTGKRTATATDYNPSALTTDYIIAVTNTDAARSVTISTEDVASGSTSQPRVMVIKDESGGANANNITISLESGTIDGAASYALTQNYQEVTLYLDGTNGHKISIGASQSDYKTIFIDAAAMIPCTTNGALQGTHEYGTNDNDFDYFAFDAGATKERVQFKRKMPENWDLGTILAKFDWSSDSGSTAGDTCEWGIKAQAIGNNEALDVAFADAGEVISDVLLADDGAKVQTTAKTPAVTVGGTPAAGKMVLFEVWRNTDGTDDMAEDAWLFGTTLQIGLSGTEPAW